MSLENKLSKSENFSSVQNSDLKFDIYDLYNRQSRINTLESLLCYLVKEDKPVNNCLIALNNLESKLEKKSEKPKLSIPQMIAEATYNAFAIIGAFVIIYCLYKAPTNYLQADTPIQTRVSNQIN
ncbi:MAG: hypothetical protein WBA41_02490 [Rivularia sp. (in: cyanobacteria)]